MFVRTAVINAKMVYAIVATKYDKIKKNGRIKQDKLIKSALKLGDDEMFIPFSTITKKGREDVLKIIESYL